MILKEEIKKSIMRTFEHLVEGYLEDCESRADFADYGDTSVVSGYWFSDYDFKSAKENACYEIKSNFEDYNSWISDGDFKDEKDYQEAKR